MRIIDQTPLISEDGSINSINRIKGTLQYGFSWYPDLQAQQQAIDLFERHLGKKFTLIRNHTLGKSKITVPLILIGPPGIKVIFVTHLLGTYRAKGDMWGTISGGNFKEASINLLKRTAQLGKAVRIYLDRKNFNLPEGIEPILLSINPGLHIASVRPIVRIVMSDAVDRFAAALAQEPPMMSVEIVHEIAEEIINPRPPKQPPEPEKKQNQPSPARDKSEIDFAFEEEDAPAAKTAPSKPRRVSRPPVKKTPETYFGLTGKQLAILGILGAILILFLVLFIIWIVLFT